MMCEGDEVTIKETGECGVIRKVTNSLPETSFYGIPLAIIMITGDGIQRIVAKTEDELL